MTSDEFEKRLKASWAELVPAGSKVLLAVSGGQDSTALMFATARGEKKTGHRFVLGFIDHGLRSAAADERDLVARHADELGFELFVRRVAAGEAQRALQAGSLQEWARARRYELLADIAREQECSHIATAHTASDQAETLIMRMLRGSGIDGLGGIMPRRRLGGSPSIEIVRPMLFASRDQSRNYLIAIKKNWSDDPSNKQSRYTRVRVRQEILATMENIAPGAAKRMAALADEAREVVRLLESDEFLERAVLEPLRLGGGVRVGRETFDKLPSGVHTRVIRRALQRVRGNLRRLERRHIEQIRQHLGRGDATGALPLPGQALVFAHRGSLYAFPGPLPEKPRGSGHPVAVGAGLWEARFAALGASVEIRARSYGEIEDWEVRARRRGDRIFESKKKLKELFQLHRVPIFYRDHIPILAWDDKVIGAPMMLSSRVHGISAAWTLDNDAPILDIGLLAKR